MFQKRPTALRGKGKNKAIKKRREDVINGFSSSSSSSSSFSFILFFSPTERARGGMRGRRIGFWSREFVIEGWFEEYIYPKREAAKSINLHIRVNIEVAREGIGRTTQGPLLCSFRTIHRWQTTIISLWRRRRRHTRRRRTGWHNGEQGSSVSSIMSAYGGHGTHWKRQLVRKWIIAILASMFAAFRRKWKRTNNHKEREKGKKWEKRVKKKGETQQSIFIKRVRERERDEPIYLLSLYALVRNGCADQSLKALLPAVKRSREFWPFRPQFLSLSHFYLIDYVDFQKCAATVLPVSFFLFSFSSLLRTLIPSMAKSVLFVATAAATVIVLFSFLLLCLLVCMSRKGNGLNLIKSATFSTKSLKKGSPLPTTTTIKKGGREKNRRKR